MTNSSHYEFGKKIAAAMFNVDPRDLPFYEGQAEAIADTRDPGYGNLQRVMCKAAARAFEEAGRVDEFDYHLMVKLAEAQQWYPELDQYSDAVIKAFGRASEEMKMAAEVTRNETMLKVAGGLGGALLGGAAKITPDVIKSIATLGVGGGALAGSLYWLLNRDSTADETDIEAMKTKRDYYKKLTGDIQSELSARPGASVNDVRNTVQDII